MTAPLTELGYRTTVRILTYGGRWTEISRTIAQINLTATILTETRQPIYQGIARKSLHLKELGFSNRKIAIRLCVDEKTVAKAIRWVT